MSYQVKQVLVVRKDLNMRKGKMIAQCGHASMRFLTKNYSGGGNLVAPLDEPSQKWLEGSFAKIVLGVSSKEELVEIMKKAKENKVRCEGIIDSGKTEFGGSPTLTCCAIGPDRAEKIDEITKDLKLL